MIILDSEMLNLSHQMTNIIIISGGWVDYNTQRSPSFHIWNIYFELYLTSFEYIL